MEPFALLASWPARRWAAAAVATVLALVVIAVPTDVLPNPFFTRSMAVTWWSYPVLLATALMTGLLVATYVTAPGLRRGVAGEDMPAPRMGMAGTVATFLAVGCPICNKLVVLALGVSGAMTWFAPLQPVLAVAALLMLGFALRVRLLGEASCRLPPPVLDAAEEPATLWQRRGASDG